MSNSPKMRRATATIIAAAFGLSGCSQLGISDWFASDEPARSGDYATASIPGAAERAVVETGVAAWDGDISSPGMTAAHATMTPGSWARVTNARTGQSAVVRITRRMTTDRGRTIELSRDAAAAVGALHDGLATVLIEPIDPRQSTAQDRMWVRADAPNQPAQVETAPVGYYAAPYAQQPRPGDALASNGVEYDPNLATASIPGEAPRAAAQSRGQTRVAPQALAPRYLQVGSYRDAKNAQRMLDQLTSEGMTNGLYGDGFIETAYVSGSVYHRVRVGPIESADQAQRALRDAKALGHNGARILRP